MYAVRVERLSYAGLQVLRVKIGRTNNIDRRIGQYKTTHADVEILDVWLPNPNLNVKKCEKGVHKLAQRYAYERDGELFTFLQDSYEEFSDNVRNLLASKSQNSKQPTVPPSKQTTNPISGNYVVKFTNGANIVEGVSGDNQTEVMVNATNYLINHHDLIQRINIPWIPGRTKAIIHNESTWDQADPAYKPLDEGYYLDTKISSTGKQREVKRMATECGLDVDFKGDW